MRDFPHPGDPGREYTRLLIVLAPLAAFGPISMDVYLPALPDMARDLHAGDAAAQLTVSACLVGLAAGQLLVGSLSDRFGRRLPVLLGVAAFVLLSLACALAPSVGSLIGLRMLQGVAGAAGIVISRAVVRDRFEGVAMARAFSLLALTAGVAPVVAPLLGGQLARAFPWRGQFVALAVIGLAILALGMLGLPETLAVRDRHTGGLAATLRAFRPVLTDRIFTGHAAVLSLGMSGLFVYLASSSLVLQNGFGLSPAAFSAVFAANAAGIIMAGRVNASVVGRFGPLRMLAVGIVAPLLAAVWLTVASVAGWGLWSLLPGLFVVIAGTGLIVPNATALALARHGRRAGTASAVLGLLQFLTGAALAPIASIGGTSAISMSVAITTVLAAALAVYVGVARRQGPDS